MKSLIVAASALALAAVAAPAFAQDLGVPSVYGNLGGSLVTQDGTNLGVVQGRLGARVAKYFGAEGELGFGVSGDTDAGVKTKLRHAYSGYVVGFAPVAPNVDVFARVGYGHSSLKGTFGTTSVTVGENSVNYGGGVQAFFTPKDGVRAEYTRFDFNHGNGAANVWSLSYVRKFN